MTPEETLDRSVSVVSESARQELQRDAGAPWETIEARLAETHLALFWPFVPDHKAPYEDHGSAIPHAKGLSSLPDVDATSVQLTAVNVRGLYWLDGRRTILEPSKALYARIPDLRRHRLIHDKYLELAKKHTSINQVFLEWWIMSGPAAYRASTLEIVFDVNEQSSIRENNRQLVVRISKSLTRNVWTNEATRYANRIIKCLCQAGGVSESQGDRLIRAVENAVAEALLLVLKEEYGFFEQFRRLFDPVTTGENAFPRFQRFLRALGWLRFYCRRDFAGNYFYSVRLPRFDVEPGIDSDREKYPFFPSSSVSVVSSSPLPPRIATLLHDFSRRLRGNREYAELMRHALTRFEEFLEKRRGSPGSGEPEHPLWTLIRPLRETGFPLDYSKLAFLCRLSRHLVGQRHEGHPLRFAFLLSFRYEQVLGQMEDVFEDSGVELTWPFEEGERGNSKLVAKWLLANALLLQRPDAVVLFESGKQDSEFPVAAKLLRIKVSRNRTGGSGGYPSTEFDLVKALAAVTRDPQMAGTAAMLVGDRRARLLIGGRTYVFSYQGNEPAQRFEAELHGDLPAAEVFDKQLADELRRLPRLGESQEFLQRMSSQIRQVVEAVVGLGHGALIAIRSSGRPSLQPLAPVWKLAREETVEGLVEGQLLTFASAAALDGATEITVSPGRKRAGRGSRGGRARVYFRTYVSTAFSPWRRDDEGMIRPDRTWHGAEQATASVATPLPIGEMWGDIMTFGTRHRSAMALSRKGGVVVLTVSADGPVRIWRNGRHIYTYKFK